MALEGNEGVYTILARGDTLIAGQILYPCERESPIWHGSIGLPDAYLGRTLDRIKKDKTYMKIRRLGAYLKAIVAKEKASSQVSEITCGS
jgi:hypothetical protein